MSLLQHNTVYMNITNQNIEQSQHATHIQYLLNLIFHCLNIILTWFYLFFQLLGLVVKDKFELFQFLILLFQVINPPFLNTNNIDF